MALPQFIMQVGVLAQQHGLGDFLIVARDPATGQLGYYGPNGMLTKLTPEIAKKIGAPDATDVEWPA
jgi:hypothetical protein